MNSAEIRSRFLEFFARHGHEIVPSSSLVPANDPTLLFTNAGMVQFKDAFLGLEQRSCPRAVTSQRCVRAGGKHNDLENVGYTARHHTFFEMLGNFSFGDYFKREAIQYAWDFLTVELGLPKERLWVTVFRDDDEAASIWLNEIGVDPNRFSRMGEKDNFWAMGDTGPCGPCSEIFYDHGEAVAGGPPGSPDDDGDRYIEIWNLVFMQFDRQADGRLVKLPKPSVDTGMGLERVSAVTQHVHSNYEIDLFQTLLAAAVEVTGITDTSHTSLRVIADHIRSCAFLIADGVTPSNEGRGYVLRRIVRRAVRHGYRLGVKDIFFYRLVAALVAAMGEAYPELVERQVFVERVLKEEEQQFARTLEHGMGILEHAIQNLAGTVIAGETVFKLYDTYGFPVDLTADVAREHGLTLDMAGFERSMAHQREMARSASSFSAAEKVQISVEQGTHFTGYEHLQDEGKILAIYVDGQAVESVSGSVSAMLLLDNTPFYGESGGQIGDQGDLQSAEGHFRVEDTQKQSEHVLHRGAMEHGTLRVGDRVAARVNPVSRVAVTLNHSATHLMHAALRKVLGTHVTQKGSLVTAERLRFDFSHPSPLTDQELATVEALVNEQIQSNGQVDKEVMPIEAAKKKGALALFGEKYGDQVRVVSMGAGFSTEFCGGCHVNRTGDIGFFKIVSEAGIAAGIRRIEAVTGKGALAYVSRQEDTLRTLSLTLKASSDGLVEKVQQLAVQNRQLEKQIEQLKAKLAANLGAELVDQAETIEGISVLVTTVDGLNAKALRDTTDQLRNKMGDPSVVVLATIEDGKVNLVASVSKGLTARIKAGDLVNSVARQVGGKGGGRPDLAMAGGTDVAALPGAMATVKPWLRAQLTAS